MKKVVTMITMLLFLLAFSFNTFAVDPIGVREETIFDGVFYDIKIRITYRYGWSYQKGCNVVRGIISTKTYMDG
jgi:hypothetical protein